MATSEAKALAEWRFGKHSSASIAPTISMKSLGHPHQPRSWPAAEPEPDPRDVAASDHGDEIPSLSARSQSRIARGEIAPNRW